VAGGAAWSQICKAYDIDARDRRGNGGELVGGYVLADVTWTDEAGRRSYLELLGPTLKAYEGEMVAADRGAQVMEGEWQPGEITVLIAFPTRDAALSWYQSDEYRQALKIRSRSSRSRLIVFGD